MKTFRSHKAGTPTHSPEGSQKASPGARLRSIERRSERIHHEFIATLALCWVAGFIVLAAVALTGGQS